MLARHPQLSEAQAAHHGVEQQHAAALIPKGRGHLLLLGCRTESLGGSAAR